MKQYDKIMVPVSISEYKKENEKQCSLPILNPNGLINQMFFFDVKGYDEKGYKALQEEQNVIVLSLEELREMFEDASARGYSIGKYGHASIPRFEDYLMNKGIQIP